MSSTQIVTNEGRQALIEYLRNSAVDPQTKKLFIKKFKLIKNESATATQVRTLAELNDKLIFGRNGVAGPLDVPATFNITSRLNSSSNRLQLVMSVPIAFSTGEDPANNITAVAIVLETDVNYAITAVNAGSKVFTIAGEYASTFTVSSVLDIQGSTGNDGEYTVASAIESGGNTLITVNETVPDSTADGDLSKLLLLAYTVYTEPFNKAANSDLTIRTSIQF